MRTWVALHLRCTWTLITPRIYLLRGLGWRVFFLGLCRAWRLLRLRGSASLALKGYWRPDCWPVVFRETSTRRLLAHTITRRLPSILRRSSLLSSGLLSTKFLTCSGVRLSSSPRDRVSMLADGTPCEVRKLLVRSTRRSVSSLLYDGAPR